MSARWGEADSKRKVLGRPLLTQMYGPAVRCKRVSSIWRMCGLASMYPASDWIVLSSGHHGYQRACDLISGQASTGPFGSPVFAGAGKTDPPSHLILSQTSAGNRLYDYVIDRSLILGSSFVRAGEAVPSSRPALVPRRRAQGAVKAGRRADLASCFGVARPRVDRSEHGATLKLVGATSHAC